MKYMKHKLSIALQIVVILVAGILGGATAGNIVPNLPVFGGSPAPASASTLTVSATAPVTAPSTALGTGFTYQGSLKSGGNPANGPYDFTFSLYDASSGGTQIGTTITLLNQTVTTGLFTVSLDFGSSAFDGNARYLQIAVRTAGGGGYTTLTPRQPLTGAPYALFALKTTPYKNVVTVAQSGGQYTTITDALNSITNASATNHYLVWVGPGTYNETVTMKQYVDIEGAGEKTTKITHVGNSSNNTGTVVGANNAELRFLTVENTGGYSNAIAIYNDSVSPSLLHVTATASGATGVSSTSYGVKNNDSSGSMSDVTVTVSGGANNNYGVENTSSSPSMTNVTVTVSGADSVNYGVYNVSNASPVMTDMTVTCTGAAGTVGDYPVSNDFSSSPTMTNIIAIASGGTITTGVENLNSSSPEMTNVVATGSGGSGSNYGMRNYSSSSPNLTNVTATASGGSGDNYGLYSSDSSATILNSVLSGTSGANNYGLSTTTGGTITVDNSKIKGGANTVNNGSGVTTRVGSSLMSGGAVSNSGTLTCYADYNENYTAPSLTVCP